MPMKMKMKMKITPKNNNWKNTWQQESKEEWEKGGRCKTLQLAQLVQVLNLSSLSLSLCHSRLTPLRKKKEKGCHHARLIDRN